MFSRKAAWSLLTPMECIEYCSECPQRLSQKGWCTADTDSEQYCWNNAELFVQQCCSSIVLATPCNSLWNFYVCHVSRIIINNSLLNVWLSDLLVAEIENNTWMCGNMKFISSEIYVPTSSKTNEWDILFNTRNNVIFPNIHVLFCLLYKK